MSEKRIDEIKDFVWDWFKDNGFTLQVNFTSIDQTKEPITDLAQALAASEHNFIIDARKDELGKLANDLSGNKVNIKFVELLERITELEGMKK